MSNLLKTLEAKLAECQAQLKTHSGYVTDIATAIEKLASDKILSTNNVNILNGAIQAYTDVMKIISEVKEEDNFTENEG